MITSNSRKAEGPEAFYVIDYSIPKKKPLK
jgi:hypothetical protein